MASRQKITLNPSQDIPFDRLRLSDANVRRVRPGEAIGELADDIARRGLLHGLSVRALLDGEGKETGDYEVPAGGRRYRALQQLVKQKRLARNAPIPCVIRAANDDILAEDDSLAENAQRVNLHPLDQFRAMQAMVEKGDDIESIAANFFVTPAVVRQRMKLASVAPALLDVYAEDGISLELLMAFTVSEDHARQLLVYEMLGQGYNCSPSFVRQKLTENSVRAADKRVRFVGIEAYVEAGGSVVRDLFETDHGGWLTDPALIDRLATDKLDAEASRLGKEGWKWVEAGLDIPWSASRDLRAIVGEEIPMSVDEAARLAELEAEGEVLSAEWSDADDVPDEVHARLDAIDAGIGALAERPQIFDPADIAIAGAFVSLEPDGSLRIERGFVKPEDEPVEPGLENGQADAGIGKDADGRVPLTKPRDDDGEGSSEDGEGDENGPKPLSDRIVSDLTAWRTLALQDAVAQCPAIAFAAVLHAFVLSCFYGYSRETCLQVGVSKVAFSNEPAGLGDCQPAEAIRARHEGWRARIPQDAHNLWDWLLTLEDGEQAALFAHCAAHGVNAQAEIVKGYDGRISAHSIARRLAHSHILARAVGLDMVAAGWRPKADGYLRSVPKPRLLADVTEARGEQFAGMIDHLKKADMAREAERLLEDASWLPEPLRTPDLEADSAHKAETKDGRDALPAFLAEDSGDPAAVREALAAE